jgi:hypothetical protein
MLGLCLLAVGCSADGDKGAWDAFWKDLRGDNMKMRSDFGSAAWSDAPTEGKLKPRD